MEALSNAEALKAAEPHSGEWVIVRHGGRRVDFWRVFNHSDLEGSAYASYNYVKTKMRQGGLALISPARTIARYYTAPRLRSRW